MNGEDFLLVVDVQNGFVNDRSRHILDPLAGFLQSWLSSGRSVALTRFLNRPGSQWETLIHWTRLRQSPETDLHPVIEEIIADNSNVSVVDKTTYTSLNAPMQQILKKIKPRRLLICGIATDGCVLKTAVDAFEEGITPIVLADLCASHAGEEVHDAGLLLIRRFIGSDQVISSSGLSSTRSQS